MIHKFNLAIFMWDEVLDAVLVEQSVLGPEIRLAERVPQTDTALAELSSKIAEFKTQDLGVSVAIPRRDVLLRTLPYPAVVQENLETMLPLEINRHLPLPEEDRAFGWTSLVDGEELFLQLVAMKNSALANRLAPFVAQEVPVDYALPCSLFLCGLMEKAPSLLLITDAQHTEICLCGGGLIRESLRITETESGAVVDAAQRLISRHQAWLGDGGVERIVGAGPVAFSESLKNELSVALGVAVQSLSAGKEVSGESDFELIPSEALVSALNPPPVTLNLTEARPHKFKMSRRAITMTALVLLLLTELIAWPILYANGPKATGKKLSQEIRALKKETAAVQEMKTEIRQMRTELSNLENLSQDQLSMMQVMKLITDVLPADAYLTTLQFEKSQQLKLQGYSETPSAIPSTLLELPFVKDIIKSDTNARAGSEYVQFIISFTLKEMTDESLAE